MKNKPKIEIFIGMKILITEEQLKLISEQTDSEVAERVIKGFKLVPYTGFGFVNSYTTLAGKPTKKLVKLIDAWITKTFPFSSVAVRFDPYYHTINFYLKK